jgi:hypothetical protein
MGTLLSIGDETQRRLQKQREAAEQMEWKGQGQRPAGEALRSPPAKLRRWISTVENSEENPSFTGWDTCAINLPLEAMARLRIRGWAGPNTC